MRQHRHDLLLARAAKDLLLDLDFGAVDLLDLLLDFLDLLPAPGGPAGIAPGPHLAALGQRFLNRGPAGLLDLLLCLWGP